MRQVHCVRRTAVLEGISGLEHDLGQGRRSAVSESDSTRGWLLSSRVCDVGIHISGSCSGVGCGTGDGSSTEAGTDPGTDPEGPTGAEGGSTGGIPVGRPLGSLGPEGTPKGGGVVLKIQPETLELVEESPLTHNLGWRGAGLGTGSMDRVQEWVRRAH